MQTTVTVTELKAPETAETEKPKIRLAAICPQNSVHLVCFAWPVSASP